MKCPGCGNTNPSNNSFCNHCGKKLSPEGKVTDIHAKKFDRQPIHKSHQGLFSWFRRKVSECRQAFKDTLKLGVVGKLPAVWGRSFRMMRECGTVCLSCGHRVIIAMPLAPSSPKSPQLVVKHSCIYCRNSLYAMATSDSEYLVGIDCTLSNGRAFLTHATKLDIQEGANLSGYGELLEATPLVVLPGPDGKPALLNTKDIIPGM
jgi:hypothetical protein